MSSNKSSVANPASNAVDLVMFPPSPGTRSPASRLFTNNVFIMASEHWEHIKGRLESPVFSRIAPCPMEQISKQIL